MAPTTAIAATQSYATPSSCISFYHTYLAKDIATFLLLLLDLRDYEHCVVLVLVGAIRMATRRAIRQVSELCDARWRVPPLLSLGPSKPVLNTYLRMT